MSKYIDADLLREGLKELESVIHSEQLLGQSMDRYDRGRLRAINNVKELIDSLQQEQSCDTCTNDKGCVTCKDGELWEGKEQPIGIHDIGVEGENGVNASDLPECQNVFKVLSKPMQVIRKCEEVGLEEEIKRYEASLPESATVDPFEGYPTLKDIARHFANWQKEQTLKDAVEEQPSGDLEEAARLYAIPHYMKDIDVNHIEEYPYDSGLEAAFKAGAEWQKSQMLRGAVEGKVVENYGCEKGEDGEWRKVTTPTIRIEAADFSIGDKVKIVIIPDKEDKK